jgi:hypothetical protein
MYPQPFRKTISAISPWRELVMALFIPFIDGDGLLESWSCLLVKPGF